MTRLHERFSFLDHLSPSKPDRFICHDTHSRRARSDALCGIGVDWQVGVKPASSARWSSGRAAKTMALTCIPAGVTGQG